MPSAVVVSPAQIAPDSETWQRAIGAIGAGAPLVIDLSTAPQLRVQAVAAVVGLLRVARRAHSDVQMPRVSRDALLAFERLTLIAYLNKRDTSPELSRTKLKKWRATISS